VLYGPPAALATERRLLPGCPRVITKTRAGTIQR